MTPPTHYLFRCPSCKTRNRIPADHADQPGKCGKCGGVLKTSELFLRQPVMITDANFNEIVLGSPIPVLVDCWAPWCSACSMVGPIVSELATEYKGRFRVGKLNVDKNPVTSNRYDTRSIPIVLIFDNGQLKDTLVGAMPKPEIVRRMHRFL
ncbi:MAG: thioredoxin [Deltaproteobacteria bacterium]|nr:thioredoxin [Deltaproteobacteria bacterium]